MPPASKNSELKQRHASPPVVSRQPSDCSNRSRSVSVNLAALLGRKNTRKTSMPSVEAKTGTSRLKGHVTLVHRIAEFFLCWFFCFAVFVFAFSHLGSDSSFGFGFGCRRQSIFTQCQLVKTGKSDRFLGDGASCDTAISLVLTPASRGQIRFDHPALTSADC
jgi:hypothetical protein